jgi:hypothetical protein
MSASNFVRDKGVLQERVLAPAADRGARRTRFKSRAHVARLPCTSRAGDFPSVLAVMGGSRCYEIDRCSRAGFKM